MSDNNKMREVWDAHDEARNKAWREEPGTFDTLDAFKAGAEWQAAQAVPVMGEPVAYRVEKLDQDPVYKYVFQEADWFLPDEIGECQEPLYLKPVSSITIAELEQLRNRVARAERDLSVVMAEGHRLMCDFQEQVRKTCAALKQRNDAEQERDALRKDAERGRLLIERGEWFRFDHDTPDAHALLAVRLPYNVDLSCKPTREDAIDAAIAAEGEKE